MARRRYRYTWDDVAHIDVDMMATRWASEGDPSPTAFNGWSGPIHFTNDADPEEAHASHDVERDRLSLVYVIKDSPMLAHVSLIRKPCSIGGNPGTRIHFVAPGCGRAVRLVALLSEGVRCARCGSITPKSRRMGTTQRLIRKARLLSERLECKSWYSEPTERPRYMRRETFWRLAKEHTELVRQIHAIIGPRLLRAQRRGIAPGLGAMLKYEM